jgi:hypothetical protein
VSSLADEIRATLPRQADAGWVLHELEALAGCVQYGEILSPKTDLRLIREHDQAIVELGRKFLAALRRRRPRRKSPSDDWYARARSAMGEAVMLAENRIAGLDQIIKARSGGFDPRKAAIYAAMLRIWVRASGKPRFSRDEVGTPIGPCIRYLGLAHRFIFDTKPPSPSSLSKIIERERQYFPSDRRK